MRTLCSDERCGGYNSASQTPLHACIVLLHLRGRIGGIIHLQRGRKQRSTRCTSRIAQQCIEDSYRAAEGRVRSNVIDVVALYPFIVNAITDAEDGVFAFRPPGNSNARLKQIPMILDQAARDSILSR